MDSGVVLSREDRKRRYGFDCASELIWHGWKAGGVYSQKLVIKNVSKKSQTLTYKLPDTKFFFMNYPETILLSPGMSTSIEISFRPIREEEYDDVVEIVCPRGFFLVRVVATLPRAAVDLVPALDFALCPVHQETARTIQFRNVGEQAISFEFNVQYDEERCPFRIIPDRGQLAAGQACDLQVSILPRHATVYVVHALCRVTSQLQEHANASVKLSAIAKYPFISLSEASIDFGDVLPGQTLEKRFEIRNPSLVSASWGIETHLCVAESLAGKVFTFEPDSGVIPPESVLTVRAIYSPVSVGTSSSGSFIFKTPAPEGHHLPNAAEIRLMGRAVSPLVEAQPAYLNFGDLAVGGDFKKVLTLSNRSAVTVTYELNVDANGGAFSFSKSSGMISPGSQEKISISFHPSLPIHFYRRVAISVAGADHPLVVDLLGTSFDAETRPQPMTWRHIQLLRHRESIGREAALLSPEELAGIPDAEFQEHLDAISGPAAAGMVSSTVCPAHRLAVGAANELFRANISPVDTDKRWLDFGFVSRGGGASSTAQAVSLTNKTNGKLTCAWVLPVDPRNGRSCFEVFPQQQDIFPGATATFKVMFRPEFEAQYYAKLLECFVFFKSMRSFRLVSSERQFVPPWCIPLHCSGHSFDPSFEAVPPQLSFAPSSLKIYFPPVSVVPNADAGGDVVGKMQLVAVKNQTNTPCLFSTRFVQGSGAFECAPPVGVLEGQASSLVAVRFLSNTVGTNSLSGLAASFRDSLQVMFNSHSSGHYASAKNLSLVAALGRPALSLRVLLETGSSSAPEKEPVPSIHFPPTFVGSSSKRELILENAGLVGCAFSLKVPAAYERVFAITPSEGILPGCGMAPVQIRFTPFENLTQYGGVLLTCNGRVVGFLHGSSSSGAVSISAADPASPHVSDVVDFGPVRLGSKGKRTVVLQNHGECVLHYELRPELIARPSDGPLVDPLGRDRPVGLTFSAAHGALPPRASKLVTVHFRPYARGLHTFKCQCLVRSEEQETAASPGMAVAELFVSGLGEHPTVSVTDAYSDTEPSKAELFRQCAVADINRSLASTVSQQEFFLFHAPTAGAMSISKACSSLADELDSKVVVDLGARIMDSPPSSITLRFSNTGVLPASISFWLPTDHGVDVEHWADAEEPSEKDLKFRHLVESKLFTISPRSGSLMEPGDFVDVTFVYQFLQMDASLQPHELPILFQQKKGKRLCLVLRGLTLPEAMPYLYVPGPAPTAFQLEDVVIGDSRPPIQYTTISNAGTEELGFEMVDIRRTDAPESEELMDAFGSFRVLRCLDEAGSVPAGCSLAVRFVFQPIEPTDHTFLAVFRCTDGRLVNIEVRARGILPGGYSLECRKLTLAPSVNQIRTPPQQDIPLFLDVSCPLVTMGAVSTFSRVERLVVVRITDEYIGFREELAKAGDAEVPDEEVDFEVLLPESRGGESIRVHPMNGVLPCQRGRNKAVLKVTIDAGSVPQVIDVDLFVRARKRVIPGPAQILGLSDGESDDGGSGFGGSRRTLRDRRTATQSVISGQSLGSSKLTGSRRSGDVARKSVVGAHTVSSLARSGKLEAGMSGGANLRSPTAGSRSFAAASRQRSLRTKSRNSSDTASLLSQSRGGTSGGKLRAQSDADSAFLRMDHDDDLDSDDGNREEGEDDGDIALLAVRLQARVEDVEAYKRNVYRLKPSTKESRSVSFVPVLMDVVEASASPRREGPEGEDERRLADTVCETVMQSLLVDAVASADLHAVLLDPEPQYIPTYREVKAKAAEPPLFGPGLHSQIISSVLDEAIVSVLEDSVAGKVDLFSVPRQIRR